MNTEESLSKENQYKKVIENLDSMYKTYNQPNKLSLIARMASISSAIKQQFKEFTFVGFYIVVTLDQSTTKVLEIGPYVSSIIATPRIAYGKGVCGSTWAEKVTKIVNNVRKCDNYIACSSDVLSEIVVPVFNQGEDEAIAVLDIDCKLLDRFDEIDRNYLELIINNYCQL
jgi:L-methionine (R)-S-oxide reductase